MNLHRGFTFQLSRLAPPTIIAIAILVLRPAAGAVGFLAATQYPVGYFPSEAVVADFNNDGHPDVASANTFSFSISILLNNGDGTFAPALDIPVQGTPQGVVSRDFNGDGKADLVVPADNTMDFLAGNGDGTFQPAVTYPVGGTSADKSNAGDFNGDSKMDVVAFVSGWPGGKDGFVVLLGDVVDGVCDGGVEDGDVVEGVCGVGVAVPGVGVAVCAGGVAVCGVGVAVCGDGLAVVWATNMPAQTSRIESKTALVFMRTPCFFSSQMLLKLWELGPGDASGQCPNPGPEMT